MFMPLLDRIHNEYNSIEETDQTPARITKGDVKKLLDSIEEYKSLAKRMVSQTKNIAEISHIWLESIESINQRTL